MVNGSIRRVAVLGAGVMGGGIAAHFAGAGLSVLLLDQPVENGAGEAKINRNALAAGAVEKMKKANPAVFFHPRDVEKIQIGNFVDDLAEAAKCDWVIEAVKEDLAVKRALFSRLEPLLSDRTIISSNTSGLSIQDMLDGRSDSFRERFLVTHFFNPVRYMHLLEVVPGPETKEEFVRHVVSVGKDKLGKGVVLAKDTPNFIANRIGLYSILTTLHLALEKKFTIEEVDALFGTSLGRPKSAVFRTADLVGLDTLVAAAKTCHEKLIDDEEREIFQPPAFLLSMVQQKRLGEKTGGGFYKKTPEGLFAMDLSTMRDQPVKKPAFDSLNQSKNLPLFERIRSIMDANDRAGQFVKVVLLKTLAYVSRQMGPQTKGVAICESLVDVDRAMCWGFGWEVGPFALWDGLGVGTIVEHMHQIGVKPAMWVDEMLSQGRSSFYEGLAHQRTVYSPTPGKGPVRSGGAGHVAFVAQDPKQVTVEALLAQRAPILQNDGAMLLDMGEGVACLSFRTKLNTIDMDVIELVEQAIERCQRDFEALVIGNDAAEAFSAGANLMMIAMVAGQGDWQRMDQVIQSFQQANQKIRFASIPVVVAPFGLTLGGGAELALHASHLRAHAELYMGLVETGVGLIPAGGGCKEMLGRALALIPEENDGFWSIRRLFEQIALAKVSRSAEEARVLGYLNERDGISMNRDFLLYEAKQHALGLAQSGYRAPRPRQYRLIGESGYATLRSWLINMRSAHQITDHDVLVGSALARVLTGGKTSSSRLLSEQDVLDLEREAFLQLCGEQKTRDRILYMLQNNKPLRN